MSSESSLSTPITPSSSASSTPHRRRGQVSRRGRRGSGRRGSGGRGSGRRGSGRRAGREETVGLVEQRREYLRNEINNLGVEELRQLCLAFTEAHPGLVFDIIRPTERQPGGYHPSPGGYPAWCTCGKCREMPTDAEKTCCGKATCVSLLPDFDLLVLYEGVLALARLYRQDVLVFNEDHDRMRANRHQAYRQYILWAHGRLSAGERRVIPSCCVWKIRDKYPDSFGQYTGFKSTRI